MKRKILLSFMGVNIFCPRHAPLLKNAYTGVLLLFSLHFIGMLVGIQFTRSELGLFYACYFLAGILQEMGFSIVNSD